jgi:hypothetical protein
MKIYAGIGARSTPSHIIKIMENLGSILAKKGAMLRSGGANGADSAFERGCNQASGLKEIFRPDDDISKECEELAKKYHPNWEACSWFAKKAHSRNCQIILGKDLTSPVNAVICWTKKGQVIGGTGQALRLAKAYNIKIINLGIDADYKSMNDFIKNNWNLC